MWWPAGTVIGKDGEEVRCSNEWIYFIGLSCSSPYSPSSGKPRSHMGEFWV